jgi:hypothetical protein
MSTFRLGEAVSEETKGLTKISTAVAPPVILRAQPDSYIQLETPEELRVWEETVRATTGLKIDASNLRGSASESCSGGCTDDCCVDCA